MCKSSILLCSFSNWVVCFTLEFCMDCTAAARDNKLEGLPLLKEAQKKKRQNDEWATVSAISQWWSIDGWMDEKQHTHTHTHTHTCMCVFVTINLSINQSINSHRPSPNWFSGGGVSTWSSVCFKVCAVSLRQRRERPQKNVAAKELFQIVEWAEVPRIVILFPSPLAVLFCPYLLPKLYRSLVLQNESYLIEENDNNPSRC